MPSEPVTIRRRGHDGTTNEWQEPGGGVFHPLPEHGLSQPVWVYGPKKAQRFFFTCPVSAIPRPVFELFAVWSRCRLMHALPHAGGWLDQPLIVQDAFPIFELEVGLLEREPPQA